MSSPASNSWVELFTPQGAADCELEFRIIKKRGQPFLIVPREASAAARALSLYPAQTTFAKAAKVGLRAALRLGVPLPLGKVRVQVARCDAFPRFLMSLAAKESGEFPMMAILAGNPSSEGQRFMMLLFDDLRRPVCVVKAGISDEARRLIQSERSFFENARGMAGVPRFYGTFTSERIEALALEDVEGDWPSGEDRKKIGALLGSWLDRSRKIGVEDVPAWQRLQKSFSQDAMVQQLSRELEGFSFHPTIHHGDFVPWNIKVSSTSGAWIVLDWERGERVGFPGWDWFHYVVQTAILVEKSTAEAAMERLENLLMDGIFKNYAKTAGIEGRERALVAAYLFYCVNVIQPGEGIETDKALLRLFFDRFFGK